MKILRFLSPLVLFALLFAGCGGGGGGVSSDDVAVVGGTHITQQDFNDLLAVQKASMKSSGQAFPRPGRSSTRSSARTSSTSSCSRPSSRSKRRSSGSP